MSVLEQWLAGKDFATRDATAAGMVNFVYLLGDPESKRAWLVDPAWDPDGLLERLQAGGWQLDGVLLTHWHPDHAGGDLWGLAVAGAAELRRRTGATVRAHRDELPWLERSAGLTADEVEAFDADAVLALGEARVRCVHTPGHTPGSTCYLVEGAGGEPGRLLTGDTLFVGGCGRIDLPGSDPREMYRTLSERLPALPESTVVLPGHDYGPRPASTLGDERRSNPYLRFDSLEAWLGAME